MPAEQFRRDRIAALADFSVGTGLEIGPLDRPMALKSECDVRYVDVFDSATIRAHYADDPAVDTAALPDIDFALHTPDGRIQSLVDAVKADAPYHWAIASHVIEHVPDLIGWLGQISEVLVDGGSLLLAVPDRRYTFDALRPQTTVGQIIQANNTGDTIPSVRAVYDYFRSVVHASATDLWAGIPATDDDRMFDLRGTMDQVRLATEEGRYVDCHVWMFTPADFVAQITELGRMGLIDFYVERVVPTTRNEIEFYAALTRAPRNATTADLAELQAAVTLGPLEPTQPEPAAAQPAAPAESESPAAQGVSPVVDAPAAAAGGEAAFAPTAKEIRLIKAKRRVINTVLRRK